ncbi:MAG: diacylglycerol kinase family protein [Proteobacteria bacterium]|nr:diacylglycerol kinase family protein [Pseudomonadota bacterium]
MNPHWLAILNPAAGRGRAARSWPRYAAALAARGINIELQTTSGPGEATRLAREAIAAGQSRILAIGGDGTLHEVLNGLIGAPTRATLALAPCGTGNDWARGRAIPRRPAPFAAMLAAGRTLAHDVGAIEYVADNGLQTRYFINLAGVGYDAYVLEQLPRRGPRALAYLTAVAAGLIRYRPPLTQIAAAGERLSGRYFATFAALGRYAGGGMQFAPRARPDDCCRIRPSTGGRSQRCRLTPIRRPASRPMASCSAIRRRQSTCCVAPSTPSCRSGVLTTRGSVHRPGRARRVRSGGSQPTTANLP